MHSQSSWFILSNLQLWRLVHLTRSRNDIIGKHRYRAARSRTTRRKPKRKLRCAHGTEPFITVLGERNLIRIKRIWQTDHAVRITQAHHTVCIEQAQGRCVRNVSLSHVPIKLEERRHICHLAQSARPHGSCGVTEYQDMVSDQITNAGKLDSVGTCRKAASSLRSPVLHSTHGWRADAVHIPEHILRGRLASAEHLDVDSHRGRCTDRDSSHKRTSSRRCSGTTGNGNLEVVAGAGIHIWQTTQAIKSELQVNRNHEFTVNVGCSWHQTVGAIVRGIGSDEGTDRCVR